MCERLGCAQIEDPSRNEFKRGVISNQRPFQNHTRELELYQVEVGDKATMMPRFWKWKFGEYEAKVFNFGWTLKLKTRDKWC